MKKLVYIILIFTLMHCTSNDIASDSQRSWCYSHAEVGEYTSRPSTNVPELRSLWVSLRQAKSLYQNDTGSQVILSTFKENLANNTEKYLQLCKIWADMNQVQ